MAIDARVLELIRCPVTHGRVEAAPESLVATAKERLGQQRLRDRLDRPVERPFDAALINEDHSLLYPITDGIPTLIPDEAIPVEPLR